MSDTAGPQPISSISALRTTPLFGRFATLALLVGLATALTSPFLSLFITRAVDATPSRLASFLFVTSLSGLLLSTAFGRLADAGARGRALLLAGAFGGCCGYAVFAVLRDYWLLLLASATLAALSSTLIPQVFTYAHEAMRRSHTPHAPFAITSLRSMFSVAWVAGPPLGAAILGLAGFTGLFAAVAGVYCLVLAASIGLSIESPQARRPALARPSGGVRAEVVVAAVAFVALQTASALGVLALPLLLTREVGATTAAVGVAAGLAAALEIPLMLMLGKIAARAERRRPLLCLGAAAGVSYYALVAVAGHVWQILIAQVLSAVFVSAIMGLGIGLFQELMPDRIGSGTALYSNTVRISPMIAGPIVGFGQQFGNRSIFGVAAGMCAVGLGLFLITAKGLRRGSTRAGRWRGAE